MKTTDLGFSTNGLVSSGFSSANNLSCEIRKIVQTNDEIPSILIPNFVRAPGHWYRRGESPPSRRNRKPGPPLWSPWPLCSLKSRHSRHSKHSKNSIHSSHSFNKFNALNSFEPLHCLSISLYCPQRRNIPQGMYI